METSAEQYGHSNAYSPSTGAIKQPVSLELSHAGQENPAALRHRNHPKGPADQMPQLLMNFSLKNLIFKKL